MCPPKAVDQAPLESIELPDVSVIVPTYGEAENLPVLVPRIAAALRDAGLHAEIVVVDDNSPDDTVEVCRELAIDYPLRLELRTTDRGLSSAVLHGMTRAKGAIFVVMDADLSHPPEKIPELISNLETGDTDFVIGSRYVRGGEADKNWGMSRWLNSKVATILAWPLTSVKDPMAGFFALRRTTFLAAERPNPIGYKIGLELLVKCKCRNVKETPIHFSDRLHGESKLTWSERFNYLRHLKRLYGFQVRQCSRVAQFVLFGSLGTLLDFIVFSLLDVPLPLGLSRGLAISVAMSWTSWLHCRYTISKESRHNVLRQYLMTCITSMPGAVISWSTSVWLCGAYEFFDQFKLVAACCGVVAGAAFNYALRFRR